MCLSSGANESEYCMLNVECSDKNDEEKVDVIDDDDSLKEAESDDEYFSQFNWPEEEYDDDEMYFYKDSNDDYFVNNHLNRKLLNLANCFEETNYKRPKRSHKKMNAQRQIKTKDAQSIKVNSHNKHIYIHHRLLKLVRLDPPSRNFIPSSSPLAYSPETLRAIVDDNKRTPARVQPQPAVSRPEPALQFRDYTINQYTMQSEPCFDDAMIAFLLDMQNRDFSPNDYEMLLRLDDRVQPKTVDNNVLNTLPTVHVDETHLTDHCTICMENYSLGQQMKLLPCKHLFHSDCIETYLKQFSTQCPLDNLPLK